MWPFRRKAKPEIYLGCDASPCGCAAYTVLRHHKGQVTVTESSWVPCDRHAPKNGEST